MSMTYTGSSWQENWGSPGPGKVRNQRVAPSKADSPSEEDPEVRMTAVSVGTKEREDDVKLVISA